MKLTLKNAHLLADWYAENKRSLPWRDTGSPYDVWISEIMLQQTRIEAVIPKYIEFKKELPDIPSLAVCSNDRLMRLWEGLGYYSRAANLKKCAIILMSSYDGQLPVHYEELTRLPGIGPYTAGAVASIAFGEAVPAIDGNVMRVIARIDNDDSDIRNMSFKKKTEMKLQDIYSDGEEPDFYRNFNQGLMELGETICLPHAKPHCEKCPWNGICICYHTNNWAVIPYRSPLHARKVIQRTILVIRDQRLFLLHRRPSEGLLANLYEFTGIDRYLDEDEAIKQVEKMGYHPLHIQKLPSSIHIFTHLEWRMKAYEIQVDSLHHFIDDTYMAVDKKEMQNIALPSAFKKYIQLYSLRQ